MKKIKLLALFLAFFAYGCSNKGYDITVTAGGSKAVLDGIENTLADFTEKTKIKVKLVRAFDNLTAKDIVISQEMNKQQGFSDVLITDTCYIQSMAAANLLEDISAEYADKASGFPQGVFAACKRSTGIYALPIAVDAYVMFCLPEPFVKAGVKLPDETSKILPSLSSVAAYHRKVNPRWLEGPFISYCGAQTEALTETFMALSGGITVTDGKVNVFSESHKEAVRAMKAFADHKKNFPMEKLNQKFLAADFMQRRSLLMIAPVSIQSDLKSEISPVKGRYTVIKMPGNKTIATGLCAAIPLNSRAKSKAKRLLLYLASNEGQVQFSLNSGYMPAIKDAALDARVVASYPHASWYYDYAAAAPVKPVLSNYQYVSERLREAITYAVSGAKSYDEAFKTIENEVTASR